MKTHDDSANSTNEWRIGDDLIDEHGDRWRIIQLHDSYRRRKQAVTIVRERDSWAILEERIHLHNSGFVLQQ